MNGDYFISPENKDPWFHQPVFLGMLVLSSMIKCSTFHPLMFAPAGVRKIFAQLHVVCVSHTPFAWGRQWNQRNGCECYIYQLDLYDDHHWLHQCHECVRVPEKQRWDKKLIQSFRVANKQLGFKVLSLPYCWWFRNPAITSWGW